MMKIRCWICWLGILLTGMSAVVQGNVPVTPERLQLAVDGLKGQFAAVDSLSYWMHREIVGGKWAGRYVVDYEFRQQRGDHFWIDWRQTTGPDTYRKMLAFDGTHTQRANPSQNYLEIWKGERLDVDPGFESDEFLLSPFRFLCKRTKANANVFPQLDEIVKSDLLAEFTRVASHVQEVQKNGRSCLQIDLPGGVDPGSDIKIVYRVYLSTNDHFYPVAWQVFDEQQRLLWEYNVEKLSYVEHGNVRTPFPAVASANYYGVPPLTYTAQPTATYRYTIDGCSFDPLSADDFLVDPTLFNYIEDKDTKTIIPIPK